MFTCGGDCSAVKLCDLLCDGKTQSGSLCSVFSVKPVKLLEYPIQFFFRDGAAMVGKCDGYVIRMTPGFNGDIASLRAVDRSILQKIIKYPQHFVSIAF